MSPVLAHLTDVGVSRTSTLRQNRPIRNDRLGEIKGQDGFDAMVFGSL
jgi:hypothetical protein